MKREFRYHVHLSGLSAILKPSVTMRSRGISTLKHAIILDGLQNELPRKRPIFYHEFKKKKKFKKKGYFLS